MKINKQLKTLSLASGAVLILSAASASAFAAEVNPFGMTELTQGYQVAGNEGKCGGSKSKKAEGKCGEGKCGDSKPKKAEGKCGEGKCGGSKPKKTEGKCGEGKCGGAKG